VIAFGGMEPGWEKESVDVADAARESFLSVTLTCATHVHEKLPTLRGALAGLACSRSFVAVYTPRMHATRSV
jgi:uncharacterized protein YaeQ